MAIDACIIVIVMFLLQGNGRLYYCCVLFTVTFEVCILCNAVLQSLAIESYHCW